MQHEHAPERAPRPLPLFLELLRKVSENDRELARDALAGLRAYQAAARVGARTARPEIARVGGASLRDHGGDGPPAVLIPSLINPPDILDLDAQVSLAAAIAGMGRRALLLDWGPADQRSHLSVAAHIEKLLLPLLDQIGEPAALVGYCLGGTMAIAAANLVPVERVATLASPWNFAGYRDHSRAALQDMWRHSQAASRELGALPMEVLQAAFWSLDPERTVSKFAEFGRLEPGSPQAQRFVALEDWANEGEALPYPAAQEMIEDLFGRDLPGTGQWHVDGRAVTDASRRAASLNLACQERPHCAGLRPRPQGDASSLPSGHVGMIVGSARAQLHDALRNFL